MRRWWGWLPLALLLSSAASVDQRVMVIPGKGVGPLMLDMPLPAVEKAWGQGARIGKTGRVVQFPRFGLNVGTSPQGYVMSIFVMSKVYHTQEGLHVGSSAAQVLKAYGKPAAEIPNRLTKALDLIYDYRGIAFGIKGNRQTGKVISMLVIPGKPRPEPQGHHPGMPPGMHMPNHHAMPGSVPPAGGPSPAPMHHHH